MDKGLLIVRRKHFFVTLAISFNLLIMNTSVFAALSTSHTSHSKLEHSQLLTIKVLEKRLHSKIVHGRKRLDAGISRANFIYSVYHLLETGLSGL